MTITDERTQSTYAWSTEQDAELVARATALRPLLLANAEASSAAGRVEPAVMDALADAGLFALTVPARFGGYETNSRTYVDVLSELARGDGSTAWSVMLLNIGNWFATTWPAQAQDEIWGQVPGATCCVVLSPGGKGIVAEGGLVVSGKWPYSSGSFAATHAIMGFLAPQPDGSFRPALGILQPGQFTVEPTWAPIGMRGTGSDTVSADGVFIPSHRIQYLDDLIEGRYATEFRATEPRSRAPFLATGTIIFGAIQVGLGKAAFDLTVERLKQKGVVGTAYTAARNSPSHQIQLAKAAVKIDAAEQLMHRSCRDIDESAISGEYLSELIRARVRNDTGEIVELVNDAIDQVLKAGGSSGFMTTTPLSRIFQDAFTAGSHVHATPGIATDVYGKLLLEADGDLPVNV